MVKNVINLLNSSQSEDLNSTMGNNQLLTCVSAPIAIFGFAYYALIFCFGVFGNVFVIVTVCKDSKLHTPFNYLVVNLAISDMCVFFFSLPIVIFSECFSWPLGELACRFSRPLFFVFTGVSVATMVALSFERYKAVVKPFDLKLTHKMAKQATVVIWALSYILFGLPKSFFYELSTAKGILQCDPVFTKLTLLIVMKTWIFIWTLILPCTVVCWAYSRVMRKLRQDVHVIGDAFPSRDVTRSRAKRNTKLMRLLITMVTVYVVCYLPFNVVTILNIYPAFAQWSYNETAESISRMLQVSHSCANPVILCLLSMDFRKALIDFLTLKYKKLRGRREVFVLQEI
ncbi:somatostatin receptor type 4-like [Oculina patagonica]